MLMPSLTDMMLANDFVYLFTDRSVDFFLGKEQKGLTRPQKKYLSEQLGFLLQDVINVRQVHGEQVLIVNAANRLSFHQVPCADALITDLANCPIAVRTADCLPVFFYDPRRKCVGVAHAGWRGTQKRIAEKVVRALQQNYQSNPRDLRVILGPAIRSCCYQVGAEFKDIFPDDVTARDNQLYLDMVKVNQRQLTQAGVLAGHIYDNQQCTCCNPEFFSYRREGADTGRHLSLIMLLDAGHKEKVRV